MTVIESVPPPLADLLEQHRRELTGYCYRMLGSASEAEDAVQESFVKAWRGWEGFEGRASVRTWLYRIAHHVCMDMHRSPQRRARPMDLGPSSRTADVVLGAPHPEETWIEPIADSRVLEPGTDPADVVAARESIRLAFVAALQHLPARQRAALILCDVLRWPATDAAVLLDTSAASVNSALQRARTTLAEHRTDTLDVDLDDDRRVLLGRYVDAFERYDTDALAALMRDDVVLSMPPFDVWLQGTDDVISWFLGQGVGCRGSRLVPIAVSGVTGFGSYKPAVDGTPGRWEPFAIQIIDTVDGRIVGHHNFLSPHRFAEFGLPPVLIDQHST